MGVRPDAQVSHVIWNVGPGVQGSGGDNDNVSLMDLTASACLLYTSDAADE